MKDLDNVFLVMDSFELSKTEENFIKEMDLEVYFKYIEGVLVPDFVGFILTDLGLVVSFPKNYSKKSTINSIKDIKLLSKLMMQKRKNTGLSHEDDQINNFPLSSYLYICNYYKKYGLYKENTKKKEYSYSGKIDWTGTLNKSNKIVSNNNLIFIPFVIERNSTVDVFVTDCMVYVLSLGYERFGQYFNMGVNIGVNKNIKKYGNYFEIIKKLKILRTTHFKDIERMLLENLIVFFEWSNKAGNTTTMLTQNFHTYWEIMVQDYINRHLKIISENGELIFEKNIYEHDFKKATEYIESDEMIRSGNSKGYRVEYDHLSINDDSVAYLFDSKYYKDIMSLDYKQVAYYYILRSSQRFQNKKVVNSLILPTDEGYGYKTHIDTRDREGLLGNLFITEHYLNIRDVIRSYLDRN